MTVDKATEPDRSLATPDEVLWPESAHRPGHCFHCGTPCKSAAFSNAEKSFCCQGCLMVFELLCENGLDDFYKLGEAAGVRIQAPLKEDQFVFLDEPDVRQRFADFANDQITRVTFHIPAIHCAACVWLLENLFLLKPGVARSQVHFPRKEVSITFENARVKPSEVAALLTSLGYEPELKFSDLDKPVKSRANRRAWQQLGIAGFAFGNIMLLSLPSYLGLDAFSGPAFKSLFGYLSFVLALPVILYSAADYWKSAWLSLRRRLLDIDVPIAAGIVAIFGQSTYEVLSGHGEGYFDSLTGLLFFLLCGKLFQRKSYDSLAFDRDYKSFFPLSVTRKRDGKEECVSLSQLKVGDRLLIRNGELIPADARLIEGHGLIDYSFVSGEAEPVVKCAGDYLYAGGRQIRGALELEMVKEVSQSYLTSLWNQDTRDRGKRETSNALTNEYSQRFTKIVLGIALGAAVWWGFINPSLSVKSFTSVLIVACPCALALAAPFALGSAQRILGLRNAFLKNPYVLETLARVDAVVFDKTGTLTSPERGSVEFCGPPLTEQEERWFYSMTRHSTHPLALRIGAAVARDHVPDPVDSFLETTGSGMEGIIAGHEIQMGSAAWLEEWGVAFMDAPTDHRDSLFQEPQLSSGPLPTARRMSSPTRQQLDITQGPGRGLREGSPAGARLGSRVHIAINGTYRGSYAFRSTLRPETGRLVEELSKTHDLAVLSGDTSKELDRFKALFGPSAPVHFNQSPADKLKFIRTLQESGKKVMMVGDGLNDAGALRQSDVGIAVVDRLNAFSPASDVIMAAHMIPRLHEVLRFAKASVRVVRASFLLSTLYNAVGISIAASGNLSPIVCAILMPLSSVSVVAFACGMTAFAGRRQGLYLNPSEKGKVRGQR